MGRAPGVTDAGTVKEKGEKVLSNRLMYAFLGLTLLIMVGMLTGSWRAVLYPFLLMAGVSILFGFTREMSGSLRPLLVAGTVVLTFGVLFVGLDLMTGGEPTGSTDYVLGMTPPMAWYLLGFPPLALLACVLYALTFKEEEPEAPLESRTEGNDGESGEVAR